MDCDESASSVLQIPELRQGSYFPSFLQPRKRSEQALVSVVATLWDRGSETDIPPPRPGT